MDLIISTRIYRRSRPEVFKIFVKVTGKHLSQSLFFTNVRGRSRAAATSKMEYFVIIVNGSY